MTDFSTTDNTETEGLDFRPDPPPLDLERVLHHDSDFLAYQCGYRWEEESLATSVENLEVAVETARIMAGAGKIVLHLTMGDKAGRYQAAKVKEYQAQRGERPEGLVKRVGELRQHMSTMRSTTVAAFPHYDIEADDGISIEMHKDCDAQNNVMWSMDKDLYMVPGLHMNPKTYELEMYPNGFGYCEIDESGKSKKVIGRGTSFFWHQMLMGDGADNIPGLPKFGANTVTTYFPSAALTNARKRLKTSKTQTKLKAARTALRKAEAAVKPKACGPVSAYEYLKTCKTDKQAFRKVYDAYLDYYGIGSFEFETWYGATERLTAGDMLLEQAKLLWMKRTPGDTVDRFFEEIART